MIKISTFLFSFLMFLNILLSQEIITEHDIKKGAEPNEYLIETTITGLKDVDIARITYEIEDVHTYKEIESNELLSNRNEEDIKFYAIGIPNSGIIKVALSLILKDNNDYSFSVAFQYALNDHNIIVQLPELIFKGYDLLAVAEHLEVELPTNKPVPVLEKNNGEIKVVEKEEQITEIAVIEKDRLAKEKIKADELAVRLAGEKAKREAEVVAKKAADERLAREKVEKEKEEQIAELVAIEKERLAKEKIKADDLAVRLAGEKVKREAEVVAKKAADEKMARERVDKEKEAQIAKLATIEKERLAKEKVKVDELAAKLAEEKEKREAEVVAKKAADEKMARERAEKEKEAQITKLATIEEELTDVKVKYTIQILSLSKFSQVRLDAYCKKHKLPKEQVSTRIVNGVTKVIYGKAKTLNEANKMIINLKLNNNIDAAFAVPL